MNYKLKRKVNIFIMIFFIVGVFANLIYMYKVAESYKAYSAKNIESEIVEKAQSECDISLRRSGLRVIRSGNTITASKSGLDDYLEVISKSSLAITQCPGYKLESFCMGTDCEIDFEMTLKKVEL